MGGFYNSEKIRVNDQDSTNTATRHDNWALPQVGRIKAFQLTDPFYLDKRQIKDSFQQNVSHESLKKRTNTSSKL